MLRATTSHCPASFHPVRFRFVDLSNADSALCTTGLDARAHSPAPGDAQAQRHQGLGGLVNHTAAQRVLWSAARPYHRGGEGIRGKGAERRRRRRGAFREAGGLPHMSIYGKSSHFEDTYVTSTPLAGSRQKKHPDPADLTNRSRCHDGRLSGPCTSPDLEHCTCYHPSVTDWQRQALRFIPP